MELEMKKVKVVKIDDTVYPPEVYIRATIAVNGEDYSYIRVFSADEIDLRGRDEAGNIIIRPID